MGQKSLVSDSPPTGDYHRRNTILARYYLPTHHLGNEPAFQSRRGNIRRIFHKSLVKSVTILSSACLGFYRLLHFFWKPGIAELGMGSTEKDFCKPPVMFRQPLRNRYRFCL